MARPCILHQISSLVSHHNVNYFLSNRAHPRSGSVQTSPTSTPMSGRRGRQLPQLPPMGKDRSKSLFKMYLLFFNVKPTLLSEKAMVQLLFGGSADGGCGFPVLELLNLYLIINASFFVLYHWCLHLLSIHNLSTRFLSFSISLSEDGDEGTEPCEGLYLNVWV